MVNAQFLIDYSRLKVVLGQLNNWSGHGYHARKVFCGVIIVMVKYDVSNESCDVASYKQYVKNKKLDKEVVTLREWYETTEHHTDEINNYMIGFKNLGRLGKELHNRGVPRVTERYGDNIRAHVETTYKRHILNYAAPLCAVSCLYYKK